MVILQTLWKQTFSVALETLVHVQVRLVERSGLNVQSDYSALHMPQISPSRVAQCTAGLSPSKGPCGETFNNTWAEGVEVEQRANISVMKHCSKVKLKVCWEFQNTFWQRETPCCYLLKCRSLEWFKGQRYFFIAWDLKLSLLQMLYLFDDLPLKVMWGHESCFPKSILYLWNQR